MSDTSRAALQTDVLDDVRRALGRSETLTPLPLGPFVDPPLEEEGTTLVNRFTAEAVSLGCKVYQVDTVKALADRVAEICTEAGAREIVLSDAVLLQELSLSSKLQQDRFSINHVREFSKRSKEDLVAHLAASSVGITAVDYAIAETGTIVLTSDEEQALLVSLLPPIHIAVLKSAQIKQSLTTVIEKLNVARMGREAPCRSATFITGPSRTSDVELTLSIGVHGPKELHLFILSS
ncbi:MAG: LutC/YkgG family protein [Pyrinomonadaceae bacterium]